MSLFAAKTVFFPLSGGKKLTGESVCGRVIRSNMRLPYTAHQAADPLFSQEHAIDRLFSRFSSFVLLCVVLCDCLERQTANLERWGVATAWTTTL